MQNEEDFHQYEVNFEDSFHFDDMLVTRPRKQPAMHLRKLRRRYLIKKISFSNTMNIYFKIIYQILLIIGKNPCTCSDVVVKAAQLPKPTYYASPQQISDAAAARHSISMSTSQSSSSSNVQINSNSNAYSSSGSSSDSNSETHGNSNSNSCSSSSSSDTSGSIVIYDNGATSSDTATQSQSGCGCSKQNIETLEIDDSQSSNGEIVPRYLVNFYHTNNYLWY